MNIKREKFIRLAEARVARAIDAIRVIGNLSNTSNYEFEDEDIKKIVLVLQSEIMDLKVQFVPKGKKSPRSFKLMD